MENKVFEDIEVLKHAKFEVSGENLLKMIDAISSDVLKQEKAKDKEDKILDVKEASEILGVTRVTLHDWHQKDILQKRHIGRRAYYYLSDIKKVLENRNPDN